jgi:predicted phage baseplate assembly protein
MITLPDAWRENPVVGTIEWEDILRGTVVYAQSEELALALEPITDPIPEPTAPPTANSIELADLYDGLKTGQWMIVSGERTDITNVSGVMGTELVMLASADPILPVGDGDNTHTLLKFANDLRYRYKRETVVVYGNVIPATHGETRNEALGSGNGSQPLQRFALRQSPVTYLAASTAAGAESTLKVYVNDVQWHETDSLAGLQPTDRLFITRTDDDDKTSVYFGNGQQGARLPTGVENVKAVYRTGIGKPGNASAGQISLLVTRPLGVKSVINPLAASGGADRESRDQARRNAPLAVMALDRLVSVQDYADFTRTFAGIGKASAASLSNGQHQLVHVTIAGADDIPIDENSDLYNNLLQAFRNLGDPYRPFKVDSRELKLLVIKARVSINADYIWEKVEPQIRAALLDTFSFERRELGQSAFLSEVMAVIQDVPGVIFVDVDTFGDIPEKQADSGKRRALTPEEITDKINKLVDQSETTGLPPLPYVEVKLADFDDGTLRPAELALLLPEVPATLVLNRI